MSERMKVIKLVDKHGWVAFGDAFDFADDAKGFYSFAADLKEVGGDIKFAFEKSTVHINCESFDLQVFHLHINELVIKKEEEGRAKYEEKRHDGFNQEGDEIKLQIAQLIPQPSHNANHLNANITLDSDHR